MNHIPCHTVDGSVWMKETDMTTIKQDKQKAQCDYKNRSPLKRVTDWDLQKVKFEWTIFA